jgi:hypothetical protein
MKKLLFCVVLLISATQVKSEETVTLTLNDPKNSITKIKVDKKKFDECTTTKSDYCDAELKRITELLKLYDSYQMKK